uniref:Hydroxysteroid (17-beta) dehydrogenase 14 n=1 Tax=Astyanax mexicanus TaxID=7994 RepID=A0A8B9JFV1_ASTMX
MQQVQAPVSSCPVTYPRKKISRCTILAFYETHVLPLSCLPWLLYTTVCLPSVSLFIPQRLITVTVEKFGQIDCLVNNAGWHPPHKPTDETTAEEFKDLLNLNLINYFLASKFALPYLRKTQGNIINVSSLVATIGQKHAAPYVATKGAIISMTKAMAVDESRYNVRVNWQGQIRTKIRLWTTLYC